MERRQRLVHERRGPNRSRKAAALLAAAAACFSLSGCGSAIMGRSGDSSVANMERQVGPANAQLAHPMLLGPREEPTEWALNEAEDNVANLEGRGRIDALQDIYRICRRAQGNPRVRDRAFATLIRIAKSDDRDARGMALTAMGRVMLRDESLEAEQWTLALAAIESGFQAQWQDPSLGYRASRALHELATAFGETMEPKLAMMMVDMAVRYLEGTDATPNRHLLDVLGRLSRNPGLDEEWFLGICTRVYVSVNRSSNPGDLAAGIRSITHLALNRRCASDVREELLELVRNHAQTHPDQDIRHTAYYWLAFATLNDGPASGSDIMRSIELLLKNPSSSPDSDMRDLMGLWRIARQDGSERVRFNAVRGMRAILEARNPPGQEMRQDLSRRLPLLLINERSGLVRDEVQRLLSDLETGY